MIDKIYFGLHKISNKGKVKERTSEKEGWSGCIVEN